MPRGRREVERLIRVQLSEDCGEDTGPLERVVIHDSVIMAQKSYGVLIALGKMN